MKKFKYFSSFFAALAVFLKIYKIMRENGLSFLMLTHIKEVDAEKKVKKIIAIFQEEAISRSAIQKEIQRWEIFYLRYFNRRVDLSSVAIPEQKFGMDRLGIMIPGISESKILSEEERQWQRKNKHFSISTQGNFDQLINDRNTSQKPYAWWYKDSPEPDLVYRNMSGNAIKESGVVGETLKERLLQGFMYWAETGDFLDKKNTTICTGTQNLAGEFPTVDFGSKTKGVCVSWVKPKIAQSNTFPREIACKVA